MSQLDVTPSARFERDRRTLLELLDEILLRLNEGDLLQRIPSVLPIFGRIDELELIPRMGGPPVPFVFEAESLNDVVTYSLAWLDPQTAEVERTCTLRCMASERPGLSGFLMTPQEIALACQHLAIAGQRWRRALLGMEPPREYPRLGLGAQRPHEADALWRALVFSVKMLGRVEECRTIQWVGAEHPHWLSKVITLAAYEEEEPVPIVTAIRDDDGNPIKLLIAAPCDRTQTTELPLLTGCRLSESSIRELQRVLIEWRDFRAARVDSWHANANPEGAGGAKTLALAQRAVDLPAGVDEANVSSEGEATVQLTPPLNTDRGPVIRRWKDICAALTGSNRQMAKPRAMRDLLKRENKRSNGPITYVGRTPEVHREDLLDWWHDIERRAEMVRATRASREAQSKALSERKGAAQRDIGFHTEKRPNARGKPR